MKTSRKNSIHSIPYLLTVGLVLFSFVNSSGQDYWHKIKRTSFGISGGYYDVDTGLALQATSPLFWGEKFAIRLSGARQWMEIYSSDDTDFVPYNSIRTGLVYNFPMMERARIYLEGGPFTVFPNKAYSEKDVIHGSYGVIGTEIFFYQRPKLVLLYFFDLGFIALNNNEEKLNDGYPYGEGVLFTTGFRFHPFGTVD